MKFTASKPGWVVLLVSLLLAYAFFGKILSSPNDYLFAAGGDGVKNYYTPVYFVKYDKGFWFTGMNYPYGEHAVFTDNQPAVSAILSWINRHIFKLSDHTIGILNCLMILSIVIAAWFFYLIMRHLYLPAWYAGAIGIILAFLSPQLLKFTGHYALSYCFVFPMIWYLAMRMLNAKSNHWWWAIGLIGTVLFFSFVHVYYMLLAGLFLFLSGFFVLISRRKGKKLNIRNGLLLLATAVLPVVLFQLILWMADPFTDRPQSPYGMMHYASSVQAVFFPMKTFLLKAIKAKTASWEGYAYIGFVGLIAAILALARQTSKLRKKRWSFLGMRSMPGFMSQYVAAAVLVLLFSMAIPFVWFPGEWLDHLGPIKQFRAIGRFAWVFYGVFTVYSARYFYLLYRRLRLQKLVAFSSGFIMVIIFIWSVDAFSNTRTVHNRLKTSSKELLSDDYVKLMQANNISPDDYQAILPLPYYNMGSEKIYLANSDIALFESMKASHSTGLPIATVYMSRTSIAASYKMAQLFSSSMIRKEIMSDLSHKRPFLVLKIEQPLNQWEQKLLNKSTQLVKGDQVSFYELSLDSLNDDLHTYRQAFGRLKDSLYRSGPLLHSRQSKCVRYKSFEDEGNTPGVFGGKGILPGEERLTLFDGQLPSESRQDTLEASVWMKSHDQRAAFPLFYYEQYDEEGMLVEKGEVNPKFEVEIFGYWIKSTITFTINNPSSRVVFYIKDEHRKIIADEFLIRPIDTDVYVQPDVNTLLMNNYLISQNP